VNDKEKLEITSFLIKTVLKKDKRFYIMLKDMK